MAERDDIAHQHDRLPIKLILPAQGKEKPVQGGGSPPKPFRTVDDKYRQRLYTQVLKIREAVVPQVKSVGSAPMRVKLIIDPGAAGVGCVFDGPPSYMYTQYGVRLDAGPANPSGRFGKSQPNWQDLPRKGRLIGSAFKVEQDREYAIQVMQGLWEESRATIWEDTERILNANATNYPEPPGD